MEAKLKKFTSFDGTRLAYYDHSEQVCEKARSVVLLHGLMSSGLDMAKFGERLTNKNLRAFVKSIVIEEMNMISKATQKRTIK